MQAPFDLRLIALERQKARLFGKPLVEEHPNVGDLFGN